MSYLFDPLAKAQKIEILKEPKKKANAFGEFARVRTYIRVAVLSGISVVRKNDNLFMTHDYHIFEIKMRFEQKFRIIHSMACLPIAHE